MARVRLHWFRYGSANFDGTMERLNGYKTIYLSRNKSFKWRNCIIMTLTVYTATATVHVLCVTLRALHMLALILIDISEKGDSRGRKIMLV